MRVSSIVASLTLAAGLTSAHAALAADPTTADCLAASDASLKSGNEHRLRAERAQLLVCAAPTCPADIRKECTRRVDEVNAEIPTITFEAKDAAGNDVSAVKVTMDGQVLTERLEGSALSIDPGERTFTFETPGQPVLTRRFVIREGQKDRREALTFGSERPPVASTASPGAQAHARAPREAPGGLGAQRVLAVVAGGAGVVGLGLGAAFGLSAMAKKNDATQLCPDTCSTAAGVSAWNDARGAGNAATIAWIAGGALVAGGVVLWLTAPSGEASAQVGLGPGSIRLKGTW